MMTKYKSPYTAIALFSGGLDSLLAVKWMQKCGYRVYPVYFLTPYMPEARALESARDNKLDLIVRDISAEHLEMMKDPDTDFGKNMNPCIDCHALMFRVGGSMLKELDAQFLISGEVLGQRPMSQRRDAMNRVARLSGYRELLVRPLSQKLLRGTQPIRDGWVDMDDMLDISGRGRSRQLELARELGIVNFPNPAGGCLLTDRNYSLRLRDLMEHEEIDAENLELLKYGRHFRLGKGMKLIVGRDEADNGLLEPAAVNLTQLKAIGYTGPLGVLTGSKWKPEALQLALDIFWHYHSKAPNTGEIQINSPSEMITQSAQKADLETIKKYRLSHD